MKATLIVIQSSANAAKGDREGDSYVYFDLIDLEFCDFLVASDAKSAAFGLTNGTVTNTYQFRLDKSPIIVTMRVLTA